MSTLWHTVWDALTKFWNYPIYTIGTKAITLNSLVVTVIALLIIWRFSSFIQRQVLARLLRHTRLERGAQFAIARIIYYLILTLGMLIVLDTMGVHLSSLAVLGGLIGVGIGFGMQHITSNFISGVILLIERPVSVGDVVTVGETTGIIKSISMRVTRILTYDNIMLYVPNSLLINEVVTNWSSEDRKVRVRISVGVSYGSDVERVRELLLKVAREHENVLPQPEPCVWFTDFGDSSLDFDLLVWIPDPTLRLDTASDLRFAIMKSFREHGIEIPFPQRDIHIRSTIPLPVEEERGV